MNKRFISVLLCLCLMASMAPWALAEEHAHVVGDEAKGLGGLLAEVPAEPELPAETEPPEALLPVPTEEPAPAEEPDVGQPFIEPEEVPETETEPTVELVEGPKEEASEEMVHGDSSGSCGAALTWSFTSASGLLRISGSGAMDDYAETNAPWYSLRSGIKRLVVEEGVTGIGEAAFACLDNLENVRLPQSLLSIGPSAFDSCQRLTEITIPDNVVTLGSAAFYGCRALEYVTWGTGLKTKLTVISDYTFSLCEALYHIYIPESVEEIGLRAFQGCSTLVSVSLPSTLTTIKNYAFADCRALSRVSYDGTQAKWENITIGGSGNSYLTMATLSTKCYDGSHIAGDYAIGAEYSPCDGGYKVAHYSCVACGAAVDANGYEVEYFTGTGVHTPGEKKYSDYSSCGGGYPEGYYLCKDCGNRVDEQGQRTFGVDGDGEHTRSSERQEDYTVCGGGYPDGYYHCTECGIALDKNGEEGYGSYVSGNDQHTRGDQLQWADHTPCGGGVTVDYYLCTVCGAYLDKDGQRLDYSYYGDVTALHRPGSVLHPANYTPCGGGYSKPYYECKVCGMACDAEGYDIWVNGIGNNLHSRSAEKYVDEDYSGCQGGYPDGYYLCTECGVEVDVNGRGLPAAPPNGIHNPGSQKHAASYTSCGGGFKEDYYDCKACYASVNAQGKELEWFKGDGIHHPGVTSYTDATCGWHYEGRYYHCVDCERVVDVYGNPVSYVEGDGYHRPGKVLHPMDFTSCSGGYQEAYYECTGCGSALNADGEELEVVWGDEIHIPGTEHAADFTPCGGGIDQTHYECELCGWIVDANGQRLIAMPGYDAHSRGSEKFDDKPADFPNGYYLCTVCGRELDENGQELRPEEESKEAMLGDADGNGKVNARDATIILRYDAGVIAEDKIQLSACDMDGNSRVNARDATIVLRIDAGIGRLPTPENPTTFTLRITETEETVIFSWDAVPGAKGYTFKCGDSSDPETMGQAFIFEGSQTSLEVSKDDGFYEYSAGTTQYHQILALNIDPINDHGAGGDVIGRSNVVSHYYVDTRPNSADYAYLAGTDFRAIRREYPTSVAQAGFVYAYEDAGGDLCVMTAVFYSTTTGTYYSTRLHNITDGTSHYSPDEYYEDLAERYYGDSRIHYMDLAQECIIIKIDMLQAYQDVMGNGTTTFYGVYVDAATLNL